MRAEENLQRMKTLDDAWNGQNWEVFRKRHSAENHLENNPYRVLFGSGEWTSTIARWKGKMIGPGQA